MRPEEYQDICRLMNDGLGLAVPFEVLSEQIERIKKNGNYIIKAAVRDNRAVGFVAAGFARKSFGFSLAME